MRLATKLATNVIVGGVTIAAAVLLKKLVRIRRGRRPALDDQRPQLQLDLTAMIVTIGEDMTAVATQSGLAEVDPQPISHVAGEGIDLDRDVAAHEEIAELRARLPH